MNYNIHKITVKSRKRETSKMFAIITFREETTFFRRVVNGKKEREVVAPDQREELPEVETGVPSSSGPEASPRAYN